MSLRDRQQQNAHAASLRRLARPQPRYAQHNGTGVVLGGNPLRAQNVSNEALGTGDTIAFSGDSGVTTQERRRVRRGGEEGKGTKKGDVKVFLQWKNNSITKFFLAGDRPATQIFEFDSATNTASGVFGEAIGPNFSDWLFTIRLYNFASKQYTLHTVYGDGRHFIVTDQKIRYMLYRGNGFWSSGIVSIDGNFSFDAPIFTQQTPPAGELRYGYWSGGAGGIFSFVEWNIPIPYLDGPSSGYKAQSANGPAVVSGADPILTALFDPDLSGDRIFRSRAEKKWIKIPGAQQDLSGLGGASCSDSGPSTTVVEGTYALNEQYYRKDTVSYKIYTAYTFDGHVSTTDGRRSGVDETETGRNDVYDFGPDFTVSVNCALFTSGGRYTLSSSGKGNGFFQPKGFEKYFSEDRFSIQVLIAPGVQKDVFSNTTISGSNTSNRTTVISSAFYSPIRVFTGGAYFTKTEQSTEYRLLLGGEQVIDPINVDVLRSAFIPVAGQLETTSVSSVTSGNIYTSKITEVNVVYYKNFVKQDDLTGKIQKIIIPEDTQSAYKSVISAWYWPQSVSP